MLKWTDCVHVHLQVNSQRADTRKILSGSCIFLTLWVFLQTAQNLHMAGPLDDFSNYLGGKNLFELSDSIQYTKFCVLFHAQTCNILTLEMPITQVLWFLLLASVHIIDANTFARQTRSPKIQKEFIVGFHHVT